ncbi:MAG: hypothetical protein ACKVOQ_23455 [Cyclobacteriaceae bacterium]
MIRLMFYDECTCEVRTAAGIEAAPRSGAPRGTRSIADSPAAAQIFLILDLRFLI